MYYIGLDLGGTSLKSGIVTSHGVPVLKMDFDLPTEKTAENLVKLLVDATLRLIEVAKLQKSDIAGVGLGAPGVVDAENGIILAMANLKEVNNLPIVKLLQDATGIQNVALENDANAACAAECWVGAGATSGARNMVMLTLGTGVGGGLVDSQRTLRGRGLAGEVGHMILHPDGRLCGCGQRGCLEAYASASAIAEQARAGLTDRAHPLFKMAAASPLWHKPLATLSAKDVFDAAQTSDPFAESLVNEVARSLGLACVSLCRLLDPELIAIGGGVAAAGQPLMKKIRQEFLKHTWTLPIPRVAVSPRPLSPDPEGEGEGEGEVKIPPLKRDPSTAAVATLAEEECVSGADRAGDLRIVLARLGNDAGYIGAAYAAKIKGRAYPSSPQTAPLSSQTKSTSKWWLPVVLSAVVSATGMGILAARWLGLNRKNEKLQ